MSVYRFVLKNGTLSYWKSQSEVNRKPQGQIGLGEACKISRNEGAATFEIFTGTKTYYLTADSNATMEDWIRVLQVISTVCLMWAVFQVLLMVKKKDRKKIGKTVSF